MWLGWIGWLDGQHSLKEAEAWIATGEQSARIKHDDWEIAFALAWKGELALYGQRDYAAAKHLFQQSLELHQAIGDPWGPNRALLKLAEVYRISGQYHEAQLLQREALQHAQSGEGFTSRVATVKKELAHTLYLVGNYQEAWTLNKDAYQFVINRTGWQRFAASCLRALGQIACAQGRYDEALHYAYQSLSIYQQLNISKDLAQVGFEIGNILVEQHCLDEAAAMFRSYQGPHSFYLSKLQVALGDFSSALENAYKALHGSYIRKDIPFFMERLPQLGLTLLHSQAPSFGIEVLAYVAHDSTTPYHARKQAQLLLAQQQKQVDEQTFQRAVEAGQRTTIDEIMKKAENFWKQ